MKATSLEAHQNAINFKENHYAKIINVLKQFNKGLTYKEIAKYIGWSDPNKVSRRMNELVNKGQVSVSETRKCSIAKSNCQTYLLA